VLVENEQSRSPFVRLDVETGTDAALAHLHDLGHQEIGYVRSVVGGQTFDRRHARWEAHLRAHGQDPARQVTVFSAFDADSTIAAGRELLTHPRRPTAVLCDDDVLACGLLAAADALGVRVPAEVAVVGFDDLDIARLSHPPLTTVHFDPEALGAAAFELLYARLQGKRPRNRVLPSELVVRGSTVAPGPG
jgi:LacI family transcriptional regulator